MSIKIVTDSACDVPEALARQWGITVVPVYINVGGHSYQEGVELSRQEFYANLSGYDPYPTTAAPALGTFAEVYERLTQDGATEILSIHLASELSATFNAARLGAAAADSAPVTLFDTRQITLGAGLLVLLAAEMAAAGRAMSEITAALAERVAKTRVFGMIDNLEALRRSGRVNWAAFGIGTLLQIKPVMMIHQGKITVAARIRTQKRAIKEMMGMVEELRPFERLAVIHVNAREAAEQLCQQAAHLFDKDQPPLTMGITPAIGAHLGVGAVGFAVISV